MDSDLGEVGANQLTTGYDPAFPAGEMGTREAGSTEFGSLELAMAFDPHPELLQPLILGCY